MTTVKLVGAIVDTHRITLYKEDGSFLTYKQGTDSVPFIINTVIPEIKRNGYFVGEIEKASEKNHYEEYEKKSKVVKFFSVAKKALANFFTPEPTVADPTEVGTVDFTVQKPEEDSGLDEVMKHAVSASDEKFDASKHKSKDESYTSDNSSEDTEKDEETLVALVDGKIIPDVQRLNGYIKSSNLLGTQEGLDNLLKRLATVIDSRKHSVEDLLVFLEKAELPISNDGRIIAYKALNRSSDGKGFVDSHTGRVKQYIGSLVETPVDRVDPDRRKDCSNGLHLARRSYLSGFGCDTCVLCYLDPVDVVAVPMGTGNKIRVTKYHILEELTHAQYVAVKSNKPLTSVTGGTQLLDKAINNKYPSPDKHTLIKGNRGTDITYSNLTSTTPSPVKESTTKAVTLEDVSKHQNKESKVDPKQVEDSTKKAVKTKPKKKASKPSTPPKKTQKTKKPTNRDKIQSILKGKTPSTLTNSDITLVWDIKRKSKKGWKVLGVSEDFVKALTKK